MQKQFKTAWSSKVKIFFPFKTFFRTSFPKKWVKEFVINKKIVLDYWKKHRYLDHIIKTCNITNETKTLDVGCGISTVLHFIEGKRFGVDSLADEYLKLYKYPEEISIKLW